MALPLLSRIDTPLWFLLAIARSGPFLPSKSPIATAAAPKPPNTSVVVKLPGAAFAGAARTRAATAVSVRARPRTRVSLIESA